MEATQQENVDTVPTETPPPPKQQPDFEQDTREELTQMFMLYEENGYVRTEQFRLIMRAIGRPLSDTEIESYTARFSYHNLTSLEGVLAALDLFDKTHKKEHTGNIREAFNVFDADGDSWISSKDIYHITTRMGGVNKLTEAEANLLLSDFDPDHTGRISTNIIADSIASSIVWR